jgi:hypothetical protein
MGNSINKPVMIFIYNFLKSIGIIELIGKTKVCDYYSSLMFKIIRFIFSLNN